MRIYYSIAYLICRAMPWLHGLLFAIALVAFAGARARADLVPPETPSTGAASSNAPVAYGQYVLESSPTPLPPVDGTDDNPLRLASFPRDFTTPLLDQPDNPVLLPEIAQATQATQQQRAGVFQRIAATSTYLPRLGSDNTGFEDTEVYGVFGVPFPTRDTPLLIEPGTDFWVVDAPHNPNDLPPNLHDDYLEFHWLGKITSRIGADIVVTPGWHSDYQNPNGAQAFRMEGHGVGSYDWTPTLKIALGVAYWDRLDAKLVPAGGFIWTPNDDMRFEIITPKPRVAYRISAAPEFRALDLCGWGIWRRPMGHSAGQWIQQRYGLH